MTTLHFPCHPALTRRTPPRRSGQRRVDRATMTQRHQVAPRSTGDQKPLRSTRQAREGALLVRPAQPGDRHPNCGGIDEAIRLYDKLLIILSEASVKSRWVEFEVTQALHREIEQGRIVLFPIRLDDGSSSVTEIVSTGMRAAWMTPSTGRIQVTAIAVEMGAVVLARCSSSLTYAETAR